ncbi:sodium/proton antiporter, CPA1 family [Rhodoferax sp. OV413]|uniref:cation:proton antiporter n=1 Tax=Rhodoferax sp. OV413 TaxID=1855285 RepID=UPI00088193D8|nr:sodium:proton antiporter [Rhodoferax sp. OV413]SDP22735.1 sodium/proton antiporter, CPA1 family [Rhodoferax sp. OV413]
MNGPTAFTLGCIVVGALLIAMTLGGSFISRLPLSSAMLYLGVGIAIGPWGLGLWKLDALKDTQLLERLTEVAVLISLFTAGMKLKLPLKDRRWWIPLRLASVSMLVTVAAVTAIGIWLLDLPPGAAVLLGAILAPTDPVLASDVQLSDPGDGDRLRFGLTGEGGLNDGTAFPVVMLGLGLLGLHDLGANGWRWAAVDVLWAIAGGLALGSLMGALLGHAILYLRTRHQEALDADEFIALGLIALTYGLALACQTYGFLAVFAAGLALQRVGEKAAAPASESTPDLEPAPPTPAEMMLAVQRFNSQLERFVEVGIVLAIGVLLATVRFRAELLWFIPLLFLLVRPLSVFTGLLGTKVLGAQRRLMAWFGIRGIGSLYYLLYAITHGLQPAQAEQLLSITVGVVVASIVVHGISVTPLMHRYEARKKARSGAS